MESVTNNLVIVSSARVVGCIACKLLLRTVGDLLDHLENAHHLVSPRADESYSQAEARFLRANPTARECIVCFEQGQPWANRVQSDIWFRRRAAGD